MSIIQRELELHCNDLEEWKKSNPNLLIARWKEEATQAQEKIIELEEINASLEAELQMEREEAAKALEKAKEWRERQLSEVTEQKDREIEKLKTQLAELQLQAQIQVLPK